MEGRRAGAGGLDGAGVFVAQCLKASGGHWAFAALQFQHLSVSAFGFVPVEQLALGLLLARCGFNWAPNGMGTAPFHL